MCAFLSSPSVCENLPAPADAAQAERGFGQWLEAAVAAHAEDPALAAFMRGFAEDPAGRKLLAALFGNSPFLTQCCLKEPALLRLLSQEGPEATVAEVRGRLNRDLAALPERPAVMRALRQAKRQMALAVAVADIAGQWPLERVTQALSDLADAALFASVRHLLAAAAAAGDIAPADPAAPERESGLIVLGLGKLGARELNYSSDIDLIILFDGERARYTGHQSPPQFFIRLTQELVRMMAERTIDGYVFRTDLRLRPDPASTPVALSVAAALAYYESAGQNWERAALIKARPVAGDNVAGAAFLAELRPYLWRRHLDFAAIRDIHSIKRQIDVQHRRARLDPAGYNVKLGRGGIREIEFFAQTQQLIWGGRLPGLRVAATLDALAALRAAGRITDDTAAQLGEAYRFFRRVEHRLQMVDDAQTHALPADPRGLAHIAVFLGFADAAAFTTALLQHIAAVERRYAALFEEAPSLAGPGNLVFTGSEDDPETLKTLAALGFAEPATAAAMVRGWHHGRYRATRSQRARELLTDLVPALLRAFATTAAPDAALRRFDQFLARLPAGVQLFSLFQRNAALLGLLAEMMGAAPRLADQLARRPGLLDAVLSQGFLDPLPPVADLAAELDRLLAQARHYEETLDLVRRWVGERKFQIGVQLLRGHVDGESAGAGFADVAEAAIAALLPRVATEFARSHGEVSGGGLVVLGLGKLGGREMTVTSDLDLILVYDAPEEIEASDGGRPLPVPTYYARLSQRLIAALGASTPEGNLYEIDMRLRPSGNKGPVAVSLAAFARYQREMAWTWEQMALTRARLVAGPAVLGAKVMEIVREVLTRPRDRGRLAQEVADMRRRIAEQHRKPSPWDAKHRAGGLIDIEFIAQFLELDAAASHPEALHQNTAAALAALARAGALARAVADELLAALKLWHHLQQLLKLTVEEPFDEAAAPPALKAILARSASAPGFDRLKADMEAAALSTRAWYEALIETPVGPALFPRSGLD